MPKIRVPYKSLLSLLLLASLAKSCTCSGPRHLRIGVITDVGCSPWALAARQKLFEKQGLQVEVKSFATLAQARGDWEKNRLDLFCSPLVDALLLSSDLHFIMVPAYSNGGDVLVARKDAGSALSDLKGARIGVPPASMGDFLLDRALAANGLTREDFTVLPTETENLFAALQKSEIQLAVAAPPASLAMMQSADMQVLFRSSSMPGEIIDVLSARPSVLQKSPELKSQIEGVWAETLQWMSENPDDGLAFVARTVNVPRATVEQDYKFLSIEEQQDYLKPEGRLLPQIDQMQSLLQQSGSLKNRQSPLRYFFVPTEK